MNLVLGQIFKKIFTKEGLAIIAFIAAIVFGILFFMAKQEARTERLLREQQKEIFEQNLFALSDTIGKKFDKKLGEFTFEKGAFVTSVDNLARYDEALARQVTAMEGNLASIIRSEIGALLPPRTDNDVTLDSLGNGNYALNWYFPYEDSGLVQRIGGKSKFRWYNKRILPGVSTLDSNYLALKLHMGFKETKDNKWEIFATSKSPYVNITELTGATFIDKPPFMPAAPGKRPFSVGPYIGWGANWDSKMQEPRFGWSIGIGVHYNIFSFGKPRAKKNNNWFKKGVDDILGNRILEHKVDSAETLYSISAKYGMSVEDIKKLNNLYNNTIYQNQILWVNL